MRIRVGFMLNHRSKNEHVLQDKCCNQEQGGHTDVQGHSEIPQRQSRRNNTACGVREWIREGGIEKKVGSYHAFLLFTFDLEQLSWHGK